MNQKRLKKISQKFFKGLFFLLLNGPTIILFSPLLILMYLYEKTTGTKAYLTLR